MTHEDIIERMREIAEIKDSQYRLEMFDELAQLIKLLDIDEFEGCCTLDEVH